MTNAVFLFDNADLFKSLRVFCQIFGKLCARLGAIVFHLLKMKKIIFNHSLMTAMAATQ